jgi:topoisomerase-4 subunit A
VGKDDDPLFRSADAAMSGDNVSEFIAVKSYKAKGKRITTFEIRNITEIEPLIREEEEELEEWEETEEEEEDDDSWLDEEEEF